MSEEKKQKLKEYQKEYQKNYNEAKRLLRIMHEEAIKEKSWEHYKNFSQEENDIKKY